MAVHHIDLRRPQKDEISRYSWDQYQRDLSFAYNGHRYLLTGGSSGWTKTEDIENSFTGYVNGLYKSNGIVFAIVLARMLLFTEARFCWFEVNENGDIGRPKGRQGLEVLEHPWPNCDTGELLARMEQDVSLGGNFYAVREGNRLRRLRPDWVTIVLTAPPAESTYSDVAGYWYHPGRSFANAGEPGPGDDVYFPDEICHWSPIPDPDAQYRGMSWLAPVVREVMADKSAMEHKLNFFLNGATFGAIISAKESLTNQQYKEWKANFEGIHTGASNAYRTLFLASPVDTSVMTANMQQLDFKVTVGAGETRLCAAGGVPPIIVGLSEGLASATYCGTYDEPVWTTRGVVKLGEVLPGDEVWSFVDGGVESRKVLHHQRTGVKPVYTIRTKRATVRFTDNHPVLVRVPGAISGPNVERGPRVEWRRVDELKVGDQIVQAKHLPDQGRDVLPTMAPATADVMQWLGAYTGDGCLNGDHGVRMCIPPTDRVRGHYVALAEQLFTKQTVWPRAGRQSTDGLTGEMVRLHGEGLTFRQIVDQMGISLHPMSVRDRVRCATRDYTNERAPIVVGESRNGFQFHSKEAVAWHHTMGVTGKAKTKRVPGWIFELREDLRLAYLAGVVDTDGSIAADGRLVIHFANRELVEDVRMLLTSCGIRCSNIAEYRYAPAVLPNPGAQSEYRAWRFTASSAVEVARIPFADPLYRERVNANQHRHRPDGGDADKAGLSSDLGFYTIRSIELDETPVDVYDIEVDGGHSFIADGIVVHNSNYGMARRKFGDHWAHPQWKSAAQALSSLVDPPGEDLRLGVNTKGIAFLREDAKDLAQIEQTKASTLSTLIMAGFEPKSCVAAVEAEDLSLLEHTGLTSVQLVPPGTASPLDAGGDGVDDAEQEYDVLLEEFRAALGDEEEIQRDRYNVRNPKGSVGGGRFRKLSDAIVALLKDEDDGKALDDFTQPQLRKAADQLGLVTPRARYSRKHLEDVLREHASGKRRPDAPAPRKRTPAKKAPAKKVTPRVRAKKAPAKDRFERVVTGDAVLSANVIPGTASEPGALERVDPDEGLVEYEGHGQELNEFIRNGMQAKILPLQAEQERAVERIDAAMAQSHTRADIGVYRGVYNVGKTLGAGDLTGVEWEESGYVSTAIDPGTAEHYARFNGEPGDMAVMQVVVPKGTPAIALGTAPPRGSGEVVLGRGLRYRVVADHGVDEGGFRRLDVEVIPPDDPEPDSVEQARQRQADIDSARRYADVAAELDELIANETSDRAILSRVEHAAARHGVDQIELSAVLAELRTPSPGSRDRARMLMARLLRREGLTQNGNAGESARFDPRAHQPIGGSIRPGQAVEVVRPGFTLDRDGEKIQIRRPVVEAVDEPAPAAGHAARDAQRRSGWKSGDKLTHRTRGEVTYLEHDERDSSGMGGGPGGAHWVEFSDGTPGMVSGEALSGYVPPPPKTRTPARQRKVVPAGPVHPDVTTGDVATTVVGDHTVAGRVTRDGDRLFVDWDGGRREEIEADDTGVTFASVAPESAPDLASLDTEDLRDSLDLKKLPELKDMLRQRGLRVSGRKRELVDRLVDDIKGGPAGRSPAARPGGEVAGPRRINTYAKDDPHPGISDEDYARILDYAGGGFGNLNRDLRGGRDNPAIAAFDRVMRDSRTTEPTTVYRGLRTGRGVFGDRLDGDLTGFEWTDEGYVSTSVESGTAAGFASQRIGAEPGVVLAIRVPPGTGALDLRGGPLDEQELLLQRGLRFRVTGEGTPIRHRGRSVRVLEVEVVGDRGTPQAPRRASGRERELRDRLATIAAEAEPLADAVARDLESTRVKTLDENQEFYRQLDRLRELGTEGRELARELLNLLVERDGAPWGGDRDSDASRWRDADLGFGTFQDVGNLDPDTRQKLRDRYVISDRNTIIQNASLRSGNPTREAENWARRMQRLVRSSELARDTRLHRAAALTPEQVMGLRPGAVIHDRGFASTATNEDGFLGSAFYAQIRHERQPGTMPVLFEIRAPRGTPAANVGHDEVVLDRDNRYRVVWSTIEENGTVRVVMELIRD